MFCITSGTEKNYYRKFEDMGKRKYGGGRDKGMEKDGERRRWGRRWKKDEGKGKKMRRVSDTGLENGKNDEEKNIGERRGEMNREEYDNVARE